MTAEAHFITLFTTVITSVKYYARVFVTVSHFHPSLIYANKVGAYLSGAPYGPILVNKNQTMVEETDSKTL